MDIFQYDSYKKILREALLERKSKISARYNFDRLAKACRIQRTYLSRVLNSNQAHLNDDQLFLACAFLGFKKEERDFLLLLKSLDQTDVEERKIELKNKIEKFKAQYSKTEAHLSLESEISTPESNYDYYLNPDLILVHLFLTVERYNKNLPLIREALNINEEYFSELLSKLARSGVISFNNGIYEVKKDNLHLSSDSSIYKPYRQLQRLKSLERIHKLPNEKTYNFSVIFSSDHKTRDWLKQSFQKLMNEVQNKVKHSNKEEVFQMNFDLFDWGN